MKGKLVKDISANTIQVICNQVMGLWIFIIISRYLDKSVYGELNWSLALLTFVTTILSLRLEQVIVRKAATGDNPSSLLTVFFGHIVFSGLLFYGILLAGNSVYPSFFKKHDLLLILAISQLLSFFSLPFKQIASGKEAFGWVAVMSSVANSIRAIGLLYLILFSSIGIREVLIIYIISSLAELIVSIYLVRSRLNITLNMRWHLTAYILLISESLPQVGVVFLNACIARIDWILLGIFSTQVITAEYSFAYKVFELSPLPMLIIAPVLLSRFSKYFGHSGYGFLKERQTEISLLIRAEMVLATALPMILNIIWVPVMDLLTHQKYGAVNKTTFFILSLSIPFQYLVNLFWTVQFSENHLARIFRITAITCFIIVAGNLIMIPLMNATGAALVYLFAMIVDFCIYLYFADFINRQKIWLPLLVCGSIALLSGVGINLFAFPVYVKLILSVTLYGILILVTQQVRKNDIVLIKQWLE